jgi:hypothetical protein
MAKFLTAFVMLFVVHVAVPTFAHSQVKEFFLTKESVPADRALKHCIAVGRQVF